MKPLVAIVGRPNVGKSTLFNKIAGKRIAIVEDTPGVTRDRIYADAEWLNYRFTLIDTGGIEPESEDIIAKQMRRQAELAIETAQVIVFLLDGKSGLTAADEDVADMLRRSKKPAHILGQRREDVLHRQGLAVPARDDFEHLVRLQAALGYLARHGVAVSGEVQLVHDYLITPRVRLPEGGHALVDVQSRARADRYLLGPRVYEPRQLRAYALVIEEIVRLCAGPDSYAVFFPVLQRAQDRPLGALGT